MIESSQPEASGAERSGNTAPVQAPPAEPLTREPVYVQADFWEAIRRVDPEADSLLECRRCSAQFTTETAADGKNQCPDGRSVSTEVIGLECPDDDDEDYGG